MERKCKKKFARLKDKTKDRETGASCPKGFASPVSLQEYTRCFQILIKSNFHYCHIFVKSTLKPRSGQVVTCVLKCMHFNGFGIFMFNNCLTV